MAFFDGLQFIGWGQNIGSVHLHDRLFEGYYGIQYSHEGSFSVSRGDEPFRTVMGPYALVTHPGIRFRYGVLPGNEPRYHIFVCFRGERAEAYLREGLLPLGEKHGMIPVLQSGVFCQNILQLQTCLQDGHQARAVHLLEGLLLQLSERQGGNRPGRMEQALDGLGQAIRSDLSRPWDFTAEARRMQVSYPHFRRLFAQHFGCAPGQFLLKSRLEHASWLLRETYEPIARIAEKTGFCDVYYFTRQFRKFLHLTPARYRKEFVG